MKDAPDLYARCVSDDTLDGSSRAKRLGAYYTDEVIATFLVSWAVRDANDTVLDPSFGGGVFLTAAARRLDTLGGTGREQVYGVEVDADVHRQISRELHARQGIAPQQLIYADFFDVAAGSAELPRFDAVIGNPPYIRYQHFSGAAKERALARVASYGVTLSRLSSSWAPFVVHSAMQLREGGRLAMVVPIELAHAAYARPVLEHLTHTFRHVSLLTFRRPLFPHLSQETVLLLADGKDEPFVSLDWRDVEGIDALAALPTPLPRCHTLDRHALASGRDRLTTRFVSPDAQQLYRTLSKTSLRLGDVANISTGYVTGANTFFTLATTTCGRGDCLATYCGERCLSRALRGLRFTADDWHEAAQGGRAGYLLSLDKRPLPEFDAQTQRYLRDGERSGAPRSYKCRRREYWYHVPRVYVPDAFLSYMSGSRPTLVSNDAGATAPNTLYLVELYGLAPLGQWTLTLLWHSSLCELSCELEGHALGDGMLKLEPAEAKRVLIPNVSADLRDLAGDVDRLLRNEQPDKARTLVDQAVLQDGLGLSARDCRLLYETAAQLRERRLYRRRMARAARRRPKQ